MLPNESGGRGVGSGGFFLYFFLSDLKGLNLGYHFAAFLATCFSLLQFFGQNISTYRIIKADNYPFLGQHHNTKTKVTKALFPQDETTL